MYESLFENGLVSWRICRLILSGKNLRLVYLSEKDTVTSEKVSFSGMYLMQ